MRNVYYCLLFMVIQVIQIPLFLVGIPICAILAYGNFSKVDDNRKWHWPKLFWLWDNEEDGTCPEWYARSKPDWSIQRVEFWWTAFRNSVNNLRYVRGVSKAGRPLWYWTRANLRVYSVTFRGRTYSTPSQIYMKAGWAHTTGWPMFSGGDGRGY